ncbi:hypothetical protein F4778DRAFT_799624 [Xylariomycetidae sp. FL2044]|nr:hypothetical protein F4778DRAFT_799624 [Xylariomycetidae sp. FL2044]
MPEAPQIMTMPESEFNDLAWDFVSRRRIEIRPEIEESEKELKEVERQLEELDRQRRRLRWKLSHQTAERDLLDGEEEGVVAPLIAWTDCLKIMRDRHFHGFYADLYEEVDFNNDERQENKEWVYATAVQNRELSKRIKREACEAFWRFHMEKLEARMKREKLPKRIMQRELKKEGDRLREAIKDWGKQLDAWRPNDLNSEEEAAMEEDEELDDPIPEAPGRTTRSGRGF